MPRLANWTEMPEPVRRHLMARMRDRRIPAEALDALRVWAATNPTDPAGDWFKDFGAFTLCGAGRLPKTYLLPGQAAKGKALQAHARRSYGACQLTWWALSIPQVTVEAAEVRVLAPAEGSKSVSAVEPAAVR